MKILLIIVVIGFKSGVMAQGTWQNVVSTSPYGSGGLTLLLSDGTVMAKSNSGLTYGNAWMKLTPDASGSYANGTWTTLAPMTNDRLYFSSQVLKDGRVYVAGGEYGAGGSSGEVYNPLTNTWTAIPDPGHRFSDANSEILPDGRVLQATVEGSLTGTLIYNPATNQYTTGPTALGIHNESVWVKLPDNSILYVDRLSTNSERFIPSLNQWVADATVPVNLYDPYGDETGAAVLLPNGKAFFIGSMGNTAIYTPSGTASPGTWTTGPLLPNGQGQTDAPAAMMVNGKVLIVTAPTPVSGNVFQSPTSFYEYDYVTNSYTRINAPNGSLTENHASYVSNLLQLPNGSVLYSVQGSNVFSVYMPSGTPVAAGKPTITQVSANSTCGNMYYKVSGTGFNGITEGASYGDDWQMNTNYPLVRLSNGSNVYYARTYDWNSTGVARGGAADQAKFTLPAGLPNATYSLVVTANGISSDPVTFTYNAASTSQCISIAVTSSPWLSVATAVRI